MDSANGIRLDDEWSRVEALLDRAFDLPEAGRERWVRDVEKDPRIADEVIALLRASDRDGLLDRPLPSDVPEDDATEAIRERVAMALAGTYRLDGVLGRGGMAIVFRAHETKHDRAVVLKVLRPEVARWVGADRFLAEIQIVARLSHPHIVSLIDSGEAKGLLYYVMPFLGGETLRDRLVRGPIAPDEARAVLRDMAEALAHAHASGLVHRDLKPDNILLVDDHAYLMDFGVAKLVRAASSPTATVEGMAVGTPGYMAPEQAMGAQVDARADVYAWGLVAREVFLGRYDPRGPLDDSIPADLEGLVRAAHSNNPDERPADGAALVAGLERASEPVAKPRWRRRTTIATLGMVVVAVGAAAAWLERRDTAPLESLSTPVVVAPFRNETGESTLEIWGRLAGDWITQGLQETGRVGVVPWPVALQAAQDSAVRGAGELVSALASETEAGTVVSGSYYLLGDRVRIEAGFVDARSGSTVADVPAVVVPRDSIESGLRELRNRAMGLVAIRTDQRVEGDRGTVEHPPTYESYRLYERGIEAYNRLEYRQATIDLEEAWRRDTLFLRPLVYAARALWNLGERGRADSPVRELRLRPTGLNAYHELQGAVSGESPRG